MYREGSINQFSQIIGLGNFYCNYLAIFHYFFQIKTFSVVDNNILSFKLIIYRSYCYWSFLKSLISVLNFFCMCNCALDIPIADLLWTFFYLLLLLWQALVSCCCCSLSVVEGHLSCIVTIFASLAVNLYFLYYFGWCHLYVENGALTIPTCGSVTLWFCVPTYSAAYNG